MKHGRLVLLLLSALMLSLAPGRAATRELSRSRQCIVVLANNWTSSTGVMRAFERDGAASVWRQRGREIAVRSGKNGLGQGRGIVRLNFEGAPNKKEGDNRAPSGVFQLSSAFGYAPRRSARWIKLRYLQLTKQIEGIDDPRSRSYNRLVDHSKVARVDWRTSEKMLRADSRYKWGVFVEHNPAAVPGAGSCIFLHIWKDSTTPTTGCTAMAEKDLVKLLQWLDPAACPILVQIPRDNYPAIQAEFGLPAYR